MTEDPSTGTDISKYQSVTNRFQNEFVISDLRQMETVTYSHTQPLPNFLNPVKGYDGFH